MSGIFVSYRRETSSGWTGRISDRLVHHFGEDQVFLDVDDIPAAVDFSEFIAERLRTVDVQVVVIDPDWATIADAEGSPRIQDPDDLLRREISIALFLGVKVIPVLVDGATMPTADRLPNDLSKLAELNALVLSATRFDADIDRLVKTVEPLLTTRRGKLFGKMRPLSVALLFGGGAAVVALVLVFSVLLPGVTTTTTTVPKTISTEVLKTAPTTERLPDGVLLNEANGHFYEAVTVPGGIDWEDAKAAAESRLIRGVQGHLVTITSQQEDLFIATSFREAFPRILSERPVGCSGGPTTVESTCGYGYWFGARQQSGSSDEPEGGWEWVTGEPFVYTAWADGQPNDHLGREEDCLNPHPAGSLWNDSQCDDRRIGGYIVEYDTPNESG